MSTKKISQTRTVYEHLRTSIISGGLNPGTKLVISSLANTLQVSLGAVREGLAMLEAEELVVSTQGKGYNVSPISISDLKQRVSARIAIEKLCLTASIEHGDVEWESIVVSSFHRLERTPTHNAQNKRYINEDWATAHADFHYAIVSACDNKWLLKLYNILYAQSERYRRLATLQSNTDRNIQNEHQQLFDAVIARDIKKAQQALATHLKNTEQQMLNTMKNTNSD